MKEYKQQTYIAGAIAEIYRELQNFETNNALRAQWNWKVTTQSQKFIHPYNPYLKLAGYMQSLV
jgi:hypothetical protein